MDKEIQKAFEKQINMEWESAYIYLSLAVDMEGIGLSGFASWMRTQVQEEMFHARKMFDYLLTRADNVKLEDIKAFKGTAKDPVSLFEITYNHECEVTKSINKLMTLAKSKEDHATSHFLQWYVDEQVEEEDTASGILQKLKFIDGNPAAILDMDRELGQRVYTEPTTTEA